MSRIESGPAQPKSLTYRNPKLLSLAKEAPHCFWCLHPNDGTIVACHSNEGKGLGIKSSDASIWFGCSKCHYAYDQGRDLTRADRRHMGYEANARTLRWLIEAGYLVLAE